MELNKSKIFGQGNFFHEPDCQRLIKYKCTCMTHTVYVKCICCSQNLRSGKN